MEDILSAAAGCVQCSMKVIVQEISQHHDFSYVMQQWYFTNWQSKFIKELPLSKEWQSLMWCKDYATLRKGSLHSWKNYSYLMNDNFSDMMQELLYSKNNNWQSMFLNELPLSKEWQPLSCDARVYYSEEWQSKFMKELHLSEEWQPWFCDASDIVL